MKIKFMIFGLVISSLILTACGNSQAADSKRKEIFVSAAVSLHDALIEIQSTYEARYPGIQLRYNFGGSGALQMQIEQGAPADIFLAAGKSQMDSLESKSLVETKSRTSFLGNKLVLVTPMSNSQVNYTHDLTKKEVLKVAMGSPQSVPAGKYAKEVLENLNLWGSIQTKLVFTEDVSQVLRYVETGNVDAGIVYESDVKSSQKVKTVIRFPEGLHSPIEYPVALVSSGKNKKEAEEFLNYLKSSEGMQIFSKYGFTTK
jgi:molybdate transport system substrate-binding protein